MRPAKIWGGFSWSCFDKEQVESAVGSIIDWVAGSFSLQLSLSFSGLSLSAFAPCVIIMPISFHPFSPSPGAPTSQDPFSFRPSLPKSLLPAPTVSYSLFPPPSLEEN